MQNPAAPGAGGEPGCGCRQRQGAGGTWMRKPAAPGAGGDPDAEADGAGRSGGASGRRPGRSRKVSSMPMTSAVDFERRLAVAAARLFLAANACCAQAAAASAERKARDLSQQFPAQSCRSLRLEVFNGRGRKRRRTTLVAPWRGLMATSAVEAAMVAAGGLLWLWLGIRRRIGMRRLEYPNPAGDADQGEQGHSGGHRSAPRLCHRAIRLLPVALNWQVAELASVCPIGRRRELSRLG